MSYRTSRAFTAHKAAVAKPRKCALCGTEPAEYAVFTSKGRASRIDVCWEDKAIIDYSDSDDGGLYG